MLVLDLEEIILLCYKLNGLLIEVIILILIFVSSFRSIFFSSIFSTGTKNLDFFLLLDGSFPFYLEHRMLPNTSSSVSHGVFLLNSAGMDIILREGVIEYRIVGGTLDLTFFSGPSPIEVIQQYGEVSGFSHLPPLYSLG